MTVLTVPVTLNYFRAKSLMISVPLYIVLTIYSFSNVIFPNIFAHKLTRRRSRNSGSTNHESNSIHQEYYAALNQSSESSSTKCIVTTGKSKSDFHIAPGWVAKLLIEREKYFDADRITIKAVPAPLQDENDNLTVSYLSGQDTAYNLQVTDRLKSIQFETFDAKEKDYKKTTDCIHSREDLDHVATKIKTFAHDDPKFLRIKGLTIEREETNFLKRTFRFFVRKRLIPTSLFLIVSLAVICKLWLAYLWLGTKKNGLRYFFSDCDFSANITNPTVNNYSFQSANPESIIPRIEQPRLYVASDSANAILADESFDSSCFVFTPFQKYAETYLVNGNNTYSYEKDTAADYGASSIIFIYLLILISESFMWNGLILYGIGVEIANILIIMIQVLDFYEYVRPTADLCLEEVPKKYRVQNLRKDIERIEAMYKADPLYAKKDKYCVHFLRCAHFVHKRFRTMMEMIARDREKSLGENKIDKITEASHSKVKPSDSVGESNDSAESESGDDEASDSASINSEPSEPVLSCTEKCMIKIFPRVRAKALFTSAAICEGDFEVFMNRGLIKTFWWMSLMDVVTLYDQLTDDLLSIGKMGFWNLRSDFRKPKDYLTVPTKSLYGLLHKAISFLISPFLLAFFPMRLLLQMVILEGRWLDIFVKIMPLILLTLPASALNTFSIPKENCRAVGFYDYNHSSSINFTDPINNPISPYYQHIFDCGVQSDSTMYLDAVFVTLILLLGDVFILQGIFFMFFFLFELIQYARGKTMHEATKCELKLENVFIFFYNHFVRTWFGLMIFGGTVAVVRFILTNGAQFVSNVLGTVDLSRTGVYKNIEPSEKYPVEDLNNGVALTQLLLAKGLLMFIWQCIAFCVSLVRDDSEVWDDVRKSAWKDTKFRSTRRSLVDPKYAEQLDKSCEISEEDKAKEKELRDKKKRGKKYGRKKQKGTKLSHNDTISSGTSKKFLV